MAVEQGTFGFDVRAAISRLRLALDASLTPHLTKKLPADLEALADDEFVAALLNPKRRLPLTKKQNAMSRAMDLMVFALEEEASSPLPALFALKEGLLEKLDAAEAILQRQLDTNELAYERHMANSK